MFKIRRSKVTDNAALSKHINCILALDYALRVSFAVTVAIQFEVHVT